jgi:hypothetical protein
LHQVSGTPAAAIATTEAWDWSQRPSQLQKTLHPDALQPYRIGHPAHTFDTAHERERVDVPVRPLAVSKMAAYPRLYSARPASATDIDVKTRRQPEGAQPTHFKNGGLSRA